MTDIDLDELERLHAAATPGPELIAENRELRAKIESLELQVSYLAVHATCGCREHGQHGFERCSNCQFHNGMTCVEVTADDWEKVARESAKMILG